jgi:adhesin/invasin
MRIPVRIATTRLTYLAAAIAIVGLAACKLSTDNPVSLTLGALKGDNQTAAAGTVFPDSLSVIVLDQYGFSTEGTTIVWAITSGGGSLSATSTTTDANGITSIAYTAGTSAGRATITATLAGVGFLTFTETIT